MSRREKPVSYQLGQHTLEYESVDQPITIANAKVVIELDSEEAYKLHLALQALFLQQEQPEEKDIDLPSR